MHICNSQFSKVKVWNSGPILTLRNEKKKENEITQAINVKTTIQIAYPVES